MKKAGTFLFIIAMLAVLQHLTARSDQQQTDTSVEATHQVSEAVATFFNYTSFVHITTGHVVMILVGLFFIYLAIKYEYEPLLLVPIGAGIIIGNIPFQTDAGLQIGIYEPGSVLN